MACPPADCQAAYAGSAEAYHCNMAQYVYPFVKTPIFALNSIFDSWQTGCILTAEPGASSATFGACLSSLLDVAFSGAATACS